jgi:hypothetical protein
MPLSFRRPKASRRSRSWSEHGYDVFDGNRDVGCIYRLDNRPDSVK